MKKYESYLELNVIGQKFNPNLLNAIIPGDEISHEGSTNRLGRLVRESSWTITTRGVNECFHFTRELELILKKINSYMRDIKELKTKKNLGIILSACIEIEESETSLYFSSMQIQQLAELDCSIDLDIYMLGESTLECSLNQAAKPAEKFRGACEVWLHHPQNQHISLPSFCNKIKGSSQRSTVHSLMRKIIREDDFWRIQKNSTQWYEEEELMRPLLNGISEFQSDIDHYIKSGGLVSSAILRETENYLSPNV